MNVVMVNPAGVALSECRHGDTQSSAAGTTRWFRGMLLAAFTGVCGTGICSMLAGWQCWPAHGHLRRRQGVQFASPVPLPLPIAPPPHQ